MQEAADLVHARAMLEAVQDRFATASDEELLADGAAVETLGRIVDALRVGFAAQVEHRSRKTLGEESLAFRRGARDGVELVQLVTGVGAPEAKRRVGIGAALAPRIALTGEVLPGRHPELATAVAEGKVGVDAARLIVNLWKAVHLRSDPEAVEAAMRALVRSAQVTDERRRDRHLVRTEAGGDDTDDSLGPEWREDPERDDAVDPEQHDARSRAMQDFDRVVESLALAARAEAEGSAAPRSRTRRPSS